LLTTKPIYDSDDPNYGGQVPYNSRLRPEGVQLIFTHTKTYSRIFRILRSKVTHSIDVRLHILSANVEVRPAVILTAVIDNS